MMETKPIGLYVHIPFCVRKCNYCDFCSISGTEENMREYVRHLIEEINSYRVKNGQSEKIKLDTVFIGGGTPSLLPPDLFLEINRAIRNSFDLSEDTEFTLEANPGTLNLDKILTYSSCGVNRISLGLQSIHENEMKILGRIHTYEEFLDAYNMVKEYLTDNINVDLMYGIPEQTKDSFAATLKAVISLSPAHISTYGLIVEEGTPFYKMRDILPLPDEDDECDMYYMADELLSQAGYSHYEISNYAKVGKRSRHNLKYWHDEEYIGVGLAAHSYFCGKRYSNTEKFSEYFIDPCAKYPYIGKTKADKDPAEYVMLALRLSDGFSLSEYYELFGENFMNGKEELIKAYTDKGLLKTEEGRIALTSRGFYVSNTIMSTLIDFGE